MKELLAWFTKPYDCWVRKKTVLDTVWRVAKGGEVRGVVSEWCGAHAEFLSGTRHHIYAVR